jgi:hypothetical protein
MNVSDAKDPQNTNTVLGKILWHQLDTVVILRQNIRQKKETITIPQFYNTLTYFLSFTLVRQGTRT